MATNSFACKNLVVMVKKIISDLNINFLIRLCDLLSQTNEVELIISVCNFVKF